MQRFRARRQQINLTGDSHKNIYNVQFDLFLSFFSSIVLFVLCACVCVCFFRRLFNYELKLMTNDNKPTKSNNKNQNKEIKKKTTRKKQQWHTHTAYGFIRRE